MLTLPTWKLHVNAEHGVNMTWTPINMENPCSRLTIEYSMLSVHTMDFHVKLNMDFHDTAEHGNFHVENVNIESPWKSLNMDSMLKC